MDQMIVWVKSAPADKQIVNPFTLTPKHWIH